MKRWIVYGCAIVLLASCASLPAPHGEDSTLVVGNLVVDFPDGFFDLAADTLDQNVMLTVWDKTEDRRFNVHTRKGGYYWFEAKPRDTYVLVSWETSASMGRRRYSLGPMRIGRQFTVEPGKVVYLGHTVFTFRAPNKVQQIGHSSKWGYEIEIHDKNSPESARAFLAASDEDNPWSAFDVVTARVTPIRQ